MRQTLQRDIQRFTNKAAIAANQPVNDETVMNYYQGIADVLQFVLDEIEV